jgi:hypothetical protein
MIAVCGYPPVTGYGLRVTSYELRVAAIRWGYAVNRNWTAFLFEFNFNSTQVTEFDEVNCEAPQRRGHSKQQKKSGAEAPPLLIGIRLSYSTTLIWMASHFLL